MNPIDQEVLPHSVNVIKRNYLRARTEYLQALKNQDWPRYNHASGEAVAFALALGALFQSIPSDEEGSR